jgi:hypothetical protein
MLEKKLLEEVKRFNAINKYGKKMIMEQDVPPAPEAGDVPPPTDVPPPPPAGGDTGNPPTDLPPVGDDTTAPLDASAPTDSTEEVDVTDLVNMVKNIKNDMESSKKDNGAVINKMDDVFTKLNDLEAKLGEMNAVMAKIDQLGAKVEEMRTKTEVERLEMRSLDSYPFNEKPQEFFAHKQGEMKQSGKNEYVLTKDEVENYPKDAIMKSFNTKDEKQDEYSF